MPESRDRLVRAWTIVEPPLGSGARSFVYQDRLREAAFGLDSRRSYRQVHPRGSSRQRTLVGHENTPPAAAGITLRRHGSPLPVWHPRTPLRDITALANAMERRRSSQRIASRRQRRSQTIESSSALTSATSPLPQGFSPSETTSVVCGMHSGSLLATVASVSASESSPRTPWDAITTSLDNPKLAELEERLEKSIDVIEKAVKENLKRTNKANGKNMQRQRVLMSMR